ncbi:MAG: hypothetical protein ACSHX8_06525 [Opitutaceae bacterium]
MRTEDGAALPLGSVDQSFFEKVLYRDRLPVGRVVAKLKRFGSSSVQWQRDFFDHRLRPFVYLELYGLYVFMNPCRADLVGVEQVYSGTRFWRPEHFEFMQSLDECGGPQPEWLRAAEEHPVETFCRGAT